MNDPKQTPIKPVPGLLDRVTAPLARLSASRFNVRAGLVSDTLIAVTLLAAGFVVGPLHALAASVTIILGLLAFTFIEYAAHRWLFHGSTGAFEAGHTRHHVEPLGSDALPFFISPMFMCLLAVLFALAMPVAYALLLAGTIATGCAAYGASHLSMHVFHSKHPWWRRWAGYHAIHHHHPDTNFGVTTGLWDVLLGTRYQRQLRAASHTPS